jgi:hypothetical protein
MTDPVVELGDLDVVLHRDGVAYRVLDKVSLRMLR